MRYFVLASGSKGNSTIIDDGKTRLVIDMGLTKTWFKEALKETPFSMEEMDYLIFTHEHIDHIAGERFFEEKQKYGPLNSLKNLLPENIFSPYEEKVLGSFKILALPISHDAYNPMGYMITSEDGESLLYMTDTGYISEKNMSYMQNATYYILESNHDVKMLLQTNRSFELKQRILNDTGHLSNEDSAMYLSQIVGKDTKEIVLAHISQEANSPEVVLASNARIMQKYCPYFEQIEIKLAHQVEVVKGGK